MTDPILIPTYRTIVWPWSDEMVCDYFDSHMNITLRELAGKSGHTLDKLKQILQSNPT